MCRHGIMHPTLQMQSYYIFFNKRSSNLVYMIKKAALYLPHFLPAHLFFLFIITMPAWLLQTDKTSASK